MKIYGLESHTDIGACPDCLEHDWGKDWKDNFNNYDHDRMPRDMHYNGFMDYIKDDHVCNVVCWKCDRVWNKETKIWAKKPELLTL